MSQVARTLLFVCVCLGAAMAAPLLGSSSDFSNTAFCKTYQCQRIAQDVVVSGLIEDRYKLNADPSRGILPVLVVYTQNNRLKGVSFEYGTNIQNWLADGDSLNQMLRDLALEVLGVRWDATQILNPKQVIHARKRLLGDVELIPARAQVANSKPLNP